MTAWCADPIRRGRYNAGARNSVALHLAADDLARKRARDKDRAGRNAVAPVAQSFDCQRVGHVVRIIRRLPEHR